MPSIRTGFALAVLNGAVTCEAAGAEQGVSMNPIRRVVTMLQMMTKKIEAQGEEEKDLYEKFMCYCKNGIGDLEKAISDAEEKIPQLESDIKEISAEALQLKEDIPAHKKAREEAKQALAEATAIREKEAAEFAAASADLKTNLAALGKAITAVESGMKGGFLQTSAAAFLKKITLSDSINDGDREALTEFLEQGSGEESQYAPQSGQIVGILKQMKDTMEKNLAELTAAEEASIKDFEALAAAKTKEIEQLTKMIEEKIQRLGKVGVEVVNMMEDLEDTKESLAEDKKFLVELQKGCATKEKEWAERCKTRSEELLAIADTIKMLNDDDALELFKKTLPAPSFLQTTVSASEVASQARAVLQAARKHGHKDHRLDLISMMLHGKSVDFGKVIKMIDDMVALLHQEQEDDIAKKEQCEKDLDEADDKRKELERTIANLEKEMAEQKDTIATLTEEIAALVEGIKNLDKEVAERTEQRKEENSDFVRELAAHTAAKELIGMAKNRMNKFYNPKLYKAPPKREMSEEQRLTVNMGGTLAPTAAPGGIAGTGIEAAFVQLHSTQQKDAPGPAPETWDAYSKNSEQGNGVIAMMDNLIKDLDTEITEMEFDEKDAQEDYENFMADAAEKRTTDSKSISNKELQKAELESSLEQNSEDHDTALKQAFANHQLIMNLHADCDWLIKYFDVRKEARNGEIDALKKAKAVLSGADYSLLQVSTSSFLRKKL
jgi:chromosome segregation ATPase